MNHESLIQSMRGRLYFKHGIGGRKNPCMSWNEKSALKRIVAKIHNVNAIKALGSWNGTLPLANVHDNYHLLHEANMIATILCRKLTHFPLSFRWDRENGKHPHCLHRFEGQPDHNRKGSEIPWNKFLDPELRRVFPSQALDSSDSLSWLNLPTSIRWWPSIDFMLQRLRRFPHPFLSELLALIGRLGPVEIAGGPYQEAFPGYSVSTGSLLGWGREVVAT